MNLQAIQQALVEADLDGWLFYDFQNRDPIAYHILGLPERHTGRRWYYYVPARGEPRGLVHTVEPAKLDVLPGPKARYLTWQQMRQGLRDLLGNAKRVAMQYSALNAIPYVSRVDAGTVELIRSCGVDVITSADLVQTFEALISPEGFRRHEAAGIRIHAIVQQTWQEIARRVKAGPPPTEYEIQQFVLGLFAKEGLVADGDAPIVAVNANAANPHYDVTEQGAAPIRSGDCLLFDIWARLAEPGSIYYDITWCGFVGTGEPPARYVQIFELACAARDRALAFVRERLQTGQPLYGWQVDQACRSVIDEAGLGAAFFHRTGHNIGTAVHGAGVNIDNLEIQDNRQIVPRVLFSIEPGIYLPEENLGVRTEIDVFVTDKREAVVIGPLQQQLVRIV